MVAADAGVQAGLVRRRRGSRTGRADELCVEHEHVVAVGLPPLGIDAGEHISATVVVEGLSVLQNIGEREPTLELKKMLSKLRPALDKSPHGFPAVLRGAEITDEDAVVGEDLGQRFLLEAELAPSHDSRILGRCRAGVDRVQLDELPELEGVREDQIHNGALDRGESEI